MAEPGTVESRLSVWALGSFHTSFLVLLIITTLVANGALGGLLGGLNTLLGFALYALLWVTVWWATGRALANRDFPQLERRHIGSVLGRAFVWGGVAGVIFLLEGGILLGVSTVYTIAAGAGPGSVPLSVDVTALLFVLATAIPTAGVVAYLIGALTGTIFGVLDALALAAARVLIHLSSRS